MLAVKVFLPRLSKLLLRFPKGPHTLGAFSACRSCTHYLPNPPEVVS